MYSPKDPDGGRRRRRCGASNQSIEIFIDNTIHKYRGCGRNLRPRVGYYKDNFERRRWFREYTYLCIKYIHTHVYERKRGRMEGEIVRLIDDGHTTSELAQDPLKNQRATGVSERGGSAGANPVFVHHIDARPMPSSSPPTRPRQSALADEAFGKGGDLLCPYHNT